MKRIYKQLTFNRPHPPIFFFGTATTGSDMVSRGVTPPLPAASPMAPALVTLVFLGMPPALVIRELPILSASDTLLGGAPAPFSMSSLLFVMADSDRGGGAVLLWSGPTVPPPGPQSGPFLNLLKSLRTSLSSDLFSTGSFFRLSANSCSLRTSETFRKISCNKKRQKITGFVFKQQQYSKCLLI